MYFPLSSSHKLDFTAVCWYQWGGKICSLSSWLGKTHIQIFTVKNNADWSVSLTCVLFVTWESSPTFYSLESFRNLNVHLIAAVLFQLIWFHGFSSLLFFNIKYSYKINLMNSAFLFFVQFSSIIMRDTTLLH